MDTKTIFATRLKELRKSKGLSQNMLADDLGISRGSISYYENGERTADIETLVKVSKYFNVDYDYLIGTEAGKQILKARRDRIVTEIEKKVVELVFIKQHIAELYKQKSELEKELEAFVGRTRETCSRTGKTINEIGGGDNE